MLSNYQNACHNAISLFTKDLYVSSCLWARAHSHKNSADTHIQRILKKPYLCSRRKRYFLHDKREIMENRGKILIIDDNEDVLFALNLLLEPYVEKVKVTTQPARIEFFMTTFQPDVILLDMNFRRDAISGQEGFDCLEQILKLDPQAIVLFMTAYADTDKAVRAIKAGAIDFIPKPWEKEKLLATLSSAIKLRDSRKEIKQLKEQVVALSGQDEMVPQYDWPFGGNAECV